MIGWMDSDIDPVWGKNGLNLQQTLNLQGFLNDILVPFTACYRIRLSADMEIA